MERIRALLENATYRECVEKNRSCEQDRAFCHHDPEHFLMVSRILYQWVLEYQLPFDKDVVFAAGLLHDIGRYAEYEKGISHDEASAELAEKILPVCHFNEEECNEIIAAIRGHRGEKNIIQIIRQWDYYIHNSQMNDGRRHFEERERLLGDLLYLADKSSRTCSFCKMRRECNWSDTKKQLHLLLL